MKYILRQLISVLLLPFLVAVVVPYWILWPSNDISVSSSTALEVLMQGMGLVLIACGLVLFLWCVSLFVQRGHGTLAPWDPTRNLVSEGPYQFVRNPMISGVAMVLIGEALLFGSWAIGMWGIAFIAVNHFYFIFSEEPGLEKRFGECYRQYKESVPRWIPRLHAWTGEQDRRE